MDNVMTATEIIEAWGRYYARAATLGEPTPTRKWFRLHFRGRQKWYQRLYDYVFRPQRGRLLRECEDIIMAEFEKTKRLRLSKDQGLSGKSLAQPFEDDWKAIIEMLRPNYGKTLEHPTRTELDEFLDD